MTIHCIKGHQFKIHVASISLHLFSITSVATGTGTNDGTSGTHGTLEISVGGEGTTGGEIGVGPATVF